MIGAKLSSIKKSDLISSVGLIVFCFLLIVMPVSIKEKIADVGVNVFYLPFYNVQDKFEELYGIRDHARQLETELVWAKLLLYYYADAAE